MATKNRDSNFQWMLAAAVFLACQGPAYAQPSPGSSPASAHATNAKLLLVAKKKPIDKSCLMICEKWGNDGCLKWVMKCKGDAGYPRGGSNTRK